MYIHIFLVPSFCSFVLTPFSALHAFLRLLPAHSRYQAHRAQYLRSGEDLFNVTLVLSPSSAATFGAVGTRAQSLGTNPTYEEKLHHILFNHALSRPLVEGC